MKTIRVSAVVLAALLFSGTLNAQPGCTNHAGVWVHGKVECSSDPGINCVQCPPLPGGG